MTRALSPEPLTREAFAPFGAVIETDGAERFEINGGLATRFHLLAAASPGPEGRAILSIFRAQRWPAPIRVEMLERHPLGSQAFMPLSPEPWLIVAAERPEAGALRCFKARGDQGVQFAPGVWHHPLLITAERQDFLVVDREGPGVNLEETRLAAPVPIADAGSA